MTRPKPPAKRQGHAARKAEVAVLPSADLPTPPPSLDEYGRDLWTYVWTAGAGVYRPELDTPIIGRYCEMQDRRRELLGHVEREGFVVGGSKGQAVMHPALRAAQELERELRQVEGLLGLNPTDRARLGIKAVVSRSKLDELRAAQAVRRAGP
jgi:P27 family predicted phage terminase small subunit